MFFNFDEEATLVAMMTEDAYFLWKNAKRTGKWEGVLNWRISNLTKDQRSRFWWDRLRTKHKTNPMRFQLFRFLWFNGVSPTLARRWIMWGDRYDTAAWKDMDHMVSKAYGRTKDKFQGGSLFNLHSMQVTTFYI